ncbi:hypothetical protein PanWU01x14_104800 [Parasponia andersonii]|uniref:Uncharacterized protein n=1 Tax=Parasponia andersonii TaxID=3476 RepID=A0A2P5D1C3_PARAD|nr:hypothetical protein PanWU01x14_104800 [Parasponia andersonii]
MRVLKALLWPLSLLVSEELESLGLKPDSRIAQFERMIVAKMASIESLFQTVITHVQIPCIAYSTIMPDDSTARMLTPITTQGKPVQPVLIAPNVPYQSPVPLLYVGS